MNLPVKSTVTALVMGLLLLGSMSVTVLFASTDSAIAKSNNSNNGNGNSDGNRGNSENAHNGNGNGGRNYSTSDSSQNSPQATANAQANAASNSRVGLIQAYEAAVIATSIAKQEYEEALTEWSELSQFETHYDNYSNFAKAYNSNSAGLENELIYWRAYATLGTTSRNLNTSREIEDMALQLAANKETDGATIERLWNLLGLSAN